MAETTNTPQLEAKTVHHHGLSEAESKKLLSQFGPNAITDENKRTLLMVFFEQFQNVLIILLLIAALVAFFLGKAFDGSLIITIVVLNALFGVYQERKAEAAIEALQEMTTTKVRVIREGIEKEIDSLTLVPGDLVYIEEGVKVPADGTVLEGTNLEANEAGLTGESLPVTKPVQETMYAGTIITRGRGLLKVTETGMRTKFGEIAASLSRIDKSKTLLERKMESFTRLLGFMGVAASFIVIFLSLYQGGGMFTSILLGVSLAVAVVPEGLPAVMTVTLAMGVREMAKRKAVLRKLSAIEALGSISVIATDKTGTLTTNSMQVKELWLNEKVIDEAKLGSQGSGKDDMAILKKIVQNGVLCSTASLAKLKNGNWQILGDPTEGALLILGKDQKFHYETLREEWRTIYEQPFNSDVKRMTVTVKQGNTYISYSKGAHESILSRSTRILLDDRSLPFTDPRKHDTRNQMETWADEGLRVLAFSYREHTAREIEVFDAYEKAVADGDQKKAAQLEKKIDNFLEEQTFIGMLAMYDPPRKEAAAAIRKAETAGIRVVMVTGDNPRTAEAIGRSIGLFKDGEEVLTGKQIEELSDKQLKEILPNVRIFARVSPFHKARIVKLYQQLGEIVGVTGDGVNDSIALKQADVGVAMGLVGTDVARETADMVLTDDNFATLVNAVEEGRNIIKNIRNAIKYLLSTNVVEAIVIILGLFLGFPNMFIAVQLLYINLLSDGIPSLILAFSPREEDVMKRKPVKKLSLLTSYDIQYIFVLGAAAAILVLGSFFYFRTIPGIDQRGVVFVVLALIQPFFLIDLWVTHQSFIKHRREFIRPLFIGAFIYPFVILGLMMSFAPAAALFELQTMSMSTFALCILISSLILIPITLFKVFVKREES